MLGAPRSDSGQGLIPRSITKVRPQTSSLQVIDYAEWNRLCLNLLCHALLGTQLLETRARLRAQDWAYSIELSVLEVYNDRLRDLLDAGSKEVTDMNAIRHEFGGAKPTP